MKTQSSIKSRETFVEASSIAAIAISVIALLITLTSSAAEFKFASVCSDDMVIQRDVASPVWGFAEPGAKVAVSLNGKAVGEATADEKGRWTVKLPAQKANKKPSTITARCGKETHSITNVLFGDVWFGCGQSNMAYTFAGYGRLPIGGEEFLKKAEGNPNIRTLLMNDGENKNSPYPREDAIGIKWETSTYKSMRKNGAALYTEYFLDRLLSCERGKPDAAAEPPREKPTGYPRRCAKTIRSAQGRHPARRRC